MATKTIVALFISSDNDINSSSGTATVRPQPRSTMTSDCWPRIDWSMCEDDTGYPAILPTFYAVSAIAFGATGLLFVTSLVQTLRSQFRDKRRLAYNTAVQMHSGIITFAVTGTCHHAALVTRESGISQLPAQLLFHATLICVAYVTAVLVRHWASLYQQMGGFRGRNDRLSRFMEIYRNAEVLEAVLTCSFFLGTVLYGSYAPDYWDWVQRVQCFAWAAIGGLTFFLVTALGQRVHVGMRAVSRSRVMILHVNRLYYVAMGNSVLWCQCAVCFAVGALLDQPLSPPVWLTVHSGINVTGLGVALLLYLVIGSTFAAKTASAIASEQIRSNSMVGVEQLQRKYREAAKRFLASAERVRGGVVAISEQLVHNVSVVSSTGGGTISSAGSIGGGGGGGSCTSSHRRVHIAASDNEEESTLMSGSSAVGKSNNKRLGARSGYWRSGCVGVVDGGGGGGGGGVSGGEGELDTDPKKELKEGINIHVPYDVETGTFKGLKEKVGVGEGFGVEGDGDGGEADEEARGSEVRLSKDTSDTARELPLNRPDPAGQFQFPSGETGDEVRRLSSDSEHSDVDGSHNVDYRRSHSSCEGRSERGGTESGENDRTSFGSSSRSSSGDGNSRDHGHQLDEGHQDSSSGELRDVSWSSKETSSFELETDRENSR